ncbi:MAG: hypothetical protein HY683_05420 [Chloroflexi bacterium]|nr:hypothetical protein [Chloroflexota bacterium]
MLRPNVKPTRDHLIYVILGVLTVAAAVLVYAIFNPVYWWVFAYLWMGLLSATAVGMSVDLLHWWARAHYQQDRGQGSLSATARRALDSTERFDWVGFSMGVVERAVFTTLTLMLVDVAPRQSATVGAPPFITGGVGVLATIAGGWIALKTVMGWRRVTEDAPAIMRLSMVGLIGSLASVFLGIVAGVLTL